MSLGHINNETGTVEHVICDNMRIDWDLEIVMDDDVTLRADVFRPVEEGKYPILLTYGPYGKWLRFKDGYPRQWRLMEKKYPFSLQNSTGKYMNWETVDPEKWVCDGYVIVRIDSRGAGRSEGVIDCWSPRETQDIYNCIELLAEQPYANGKVGMLGISYYAVNQWAAAALNPPHLVAICPFEGLNDQYRDSARNGGILNTFTEKWWKVQVAKLQHGRGDNGLISQLTGKSITGPETLTEEELTEIQSKTVAPSQNMLERELIDDWYRERITDLSQIKIPVLSCGNWSGYGLHLRGNVEGYQRISSQQKWLEMHGLEHFAEFYNPYGVDLQKRFFNHFLKGMDTWHQAPVHLRLRNVDGTFTDRDEQEWPLARTVWTKYYLDMNRLHLTTEKPASGETSFYALSNGLSFFTPPLTHKLEITGPAAAKLFVKSSTEDADIFVTLRVLDPEGNDVTFPSASDPKGIVAVGWLRASHRKLDLEKSLPYRPWHVHDEKQPLTPGQTYELDVEIWPTSVVIPAGYRLGVAISGKDFEIPNYGAALRTLSTVFSGNGHYTHDNPIDRPEKLFGGDTTLVAQEEQLPYILLPIIPEE